MMTSRDDIQRWLERAGPGVTHVAVVCDTFDHSNYPVYITATDEADCERKVAAQSTGNMRQLMECYSLTGKHTLAGQLDSRRACNYD